MNFTFPKKISFLCIENSEMGKGWGIWSIVLYPKSFTSMFGQDFGKLKVLILESEVFGQAFEKK